MSFDATDKVCKGIFQFLSSQRGDWAAEDDVVPEEPLRDDIMFWPDGATTRNYELDEMQENEHE